MGGSSDPSTGGIINATACLSAYDLCNVMSEIPYELTGKNPYDMRIPCEHGRLCYDFDMVTTYLNKQSVQQALGVSKKWGSCNMAVNLLFVTAGDWMINYHTLLPDLLADGIKVLIYAGDCDYICNWLGNMKWTMQMDWPHKSDFVAPATGSVSCRCSMQVTWCLWISQLWRCRWSTIIYPANWVLTMSLSYRFCIDAQV